MKIELRTERHRAQPDHRRVPHRQAGRPRAAGHVRVPRRPRGHASLLLQSASRGRLPPDARRAGRQAAQIEMKHARAAGAVRRAGGRLDAGRWRGICATRCPASPATTTASSGTCGGCATCSRRRASPISTPTYLFYPFGTTIADHPHTALPALVAATVLKPCVGGHGAEPAAARVHLREHGVRRTRWSGTSRGTAAARSCGGVIFGLSPYLAVAPARTLRSGGRVGAAAVRAGAAPRPCASRSNRGRSPPASCSRRRHTPRTTTSSTCRSSRACTCRLARWSPIAWWRRGAATRQHAAMRRGCSCCDRSAVGDRRSGSSRPAARR